MLIDRINQRLKETGKSVQGTSVEATGAKETLRKILDGTTRNPRIDTITKIASALGTTTEWLMGGTPAGANGSTEQKAEDHVPADALVVPPQIASAAEAPPLPQRHSMPLDIPVMGTAAGSLLRGAFQFEGGVVDYVRRPPALVGARDVYALFVEGSSMEPQYFPGDLIYVNPNRPPRLGDIVVVQCKNGPYAPDEASLGIFRRRTAETLVIAKRNPDSEVIFKHEHVRAVHRVLTMNELFGV